MVSRILRRSGVAVGMIAELLEWKPDFIVQVGVGIHHEEMDVLKGEWSEVEIDGFEPHPKTYNAIRKEYPGTLYQMAVLDRHKPVKLYYHGRHKDGSSIHRLNEDGREVHEIEVSCTTLDSSYIDSMGGEEWVGGEEKILLWLDCEGSELKVLKGGEKFIKHVDVINIEMTNKPSAAKSWPSPVQIHNWLRKHDFWLQWIHTQRSTAGQYDAIYVRSHLFKPEYCSSPYAQKEWRRRKR